MQFRFRAFLSGTFTLPTDQTIAKWTARFKHIGEQPDGSRDYLADFFLEAEQSSDAFHRGFERAKKAADLLGYMSLCPVRLIPLSATIPTVRIGTPFPISTLQQEMHWNVAEVIAADLTKFDLTSGLEVLDLMRAARASLSNEDPLASFVRCWAAFEPELKKYANANDLLTPLTACPKCGAPTGGGQPATQMALQQLLDDAKSQEDENPGALDARTLRKIRGMIAHGADLGDEKFRKDFQGALPSLLSAIVMYIWRTSGIKTAFNNRAMAYPELAQFSMIFTSATQVGIDWSAPSNMSTSIAMISIASTASLNQNSTFRASLSEQASYNIDFLPEVTSD